MMLKWVEELVSQLMFLFTGVMVLACFGILAVAAIIVFICAIAMLIGIVHALGWA